MRWRAGRDSAGLDDFKGWGTVVDGDNDKEED